MIRRYALATVLAVALTQTGCPSDPYDPHTWIEKLESPDPQEVTRAVTELQRLKDPVAIAALGKAWDKQNRASIILRAIVELASREEDGNGPNWEDAVPTLRTAVAELDEGDQRSIDNAIMAADALGLSKDTDSIPTLIKAANKVMPNLSKGQQARMAAIRALGKFGNQPSSVDALIKVLESDIKDQSWRLFAAAAEALADARSPKAVPPLLETYYKVAHPAVSSRCLVALVAIGKPVIPEAIKIFEGEHKAINKVAKDQQFNIDCDKGRGPDTKCKAPGNLPYKASQLLGHLRAKQAVKTMLGELKKPALEAYFSPQGAAGPSQHAGILDALKRIGDTSAASAVLAYATDEKTDDNLRPLAIDVYSYLTTKTDALPTFAKMIRDDGAEEQVRLAAGVTYGRLTNNAKSYEPLTYMIERYRKEANKVAAKQKKADTAHEKAEKAYKEAQKKADADPDNKKLADKAKKTKDRMDDKHLAANRVANEVAGYRRFQRTFEQNLVRAYIGVRCKKDPNCYLEMVDANPDDIGKELAKYIKDWKDWTDDEKAGLKVAAMERSLLQLAKMGEDARSVVDKILEKVESTDRILRQGSLLVMMRAAQLPCEKCVKRLDAVLAEQKGQTTLNQLNNETVVARNYFLWAGT